jgi:transcriptional regulator with XRE-family HTH domain
MEPAHALGVAIEAEMIMALMTRDELAANLGISTETLGRHIRGEQEPSLARLRAIAAAMETTPQQILTRADVVAGRIDRRAGSAATQANAGGQNVQVMGPVHIEGDVTMTESDQG